MKKKRTVILLLVLSLCLPIFAFAEAVKGLSQDTHLATGLLDYSDKGCMLFLPGNISSLSAAPILICLPGVNVKAKHDIASWSPSAGEKGFVVLDLDIDFTRITSFVDVDALYSRIMDIIDSLAKQYPVSRDKLYIAGTSAGGMLAISLGLRYPEKFIAIGVVSGAALSFGADKELRNALGQRFYMVHGIKDEIVPIQMFYSIKEILKQNGAIIEYNVYPDDKHPVNPDGYKKVIEWMSGLEPSN